MKKIAFLFPGQGSQYVGMGQDLHENYSVVRDLFEKASDTLSIDFKNLCFKGPDEILRETKNVQPAVTLVDVACYEVLKMEGITPDACAGHSLGEYTALYAAGSVDFIDLMKLVKFRGSFMHEASQKYPGGMVAIMGIELDKVQKICEGLKDVGSVEIANYNSPSQIIITGEKNALEKAMELAKKEKAKLTIPLKVSGPWHSKFMAEAQSSMAIVLRGQVIKRSIIPVIANVTADYESDPEEIKENLINQITSPVLWSASMTRLISDGYKVFVEAGPAKVLKGIMRDLSKEVRTCNVENIETLRAFLASSEEST